MPGGRVWASIELVIVDVVTGPPHGSFNNCRVSGGSSDVAGLGGSPSKGDPEVDDAPVKFHSRTIHSDVNALIDSGATENFISPELVEHFWISTLDVKPRVI